jgi:hypothetical protein
MCKDIGVIFHLPIESIFKHEFEVLRMDDGIAVGRKNRVPIMLKCWYLVYSLIVAARNKYSGDT